LDPVKNGVVSQGAYDRPLDDVKRRVALDILAEVRRTIREQSGDYVRLKVFYPTADKGKKSANEIFVIGLELGAVEISVSDTGMFFFLAFSQNPWTLAFCQRRCGETFIDNGVAKWRESSKSSRRIMTAFVVLLAVDKDPLQ
jgi:hypothetical protein